MDSASFMADAVVVLHAAYVLFVVLGLAVILLGWARGWGWVRNFWLRLIHLAAIGFVAAEAVFDMACPLTTVERSLREQAGEATYAGDFIGHWAHEFVFLGAMKVPDWAFTACYLGFALTVGLVFWLAPPGWPGRAKGGAKPAILNRPHGSVIGVRK